MKRIILMVAIYSFYQSSSAQQIKPFVVNAAGNTFANSTSKLAYSIGELAITKVNNTNHAITQGFLQAKSIGSGLEKSEIQNAFTFFPNPTSDLLHVAMSEKKAPYQVKLIDAFGRIIFTGVLKEDQVALQTYPNGLYQVLIINQQNKVVAQTTISKIN
jgi:Secretion system C-terminal sorting domain